MRKQRKSVISIYVVILISVLFISGCAKQEVSSGVPTLIWWQIGNGITVNDAESIKKISDYTEEKIGVRFEIKQAGWGDAAQRFQTIVNSGEYFDIMFTDKDQYNKLVNIGAFADITDSLPAESPLLWNYIPELLWTGAKINERIYAVPTYKDSSKTMYYVWDHAYVQKYDIDISKTSFADLDTAFRKIKAGEGQRFYPFILAKGENTFIVDDYDSLAANLPPIGVKLDDETRTVVNLFEQEDVLEKLRYLHLWFKDGIINPDANVAENVPKYRTFFMVQGWSGVGPSLAISAGIEQYDMVQAFGPSYSTDSIQGSLNAVSSNSRYKNEALRLLELVNMDRKFRDMLIYGLEGTHFTYVTEDIVHRNVTDWSLINYQLGTYFNMSVPDDMPEGYWDEVRQLNEDAVPSVMIGFVMDIEPVQIELTNCRTVWEKYQYDIRTGAADPDVVVPLLISELKKNGFDRIVAEAQRQVDAHYK